MFRLSDYAYSLPEECIALRPVPRRDRSRLLLLNRQSGKAAHYFFSDLPDLLRSDDLIVINNTKVIPGRLFGKKATGGKVEVLLLDLPAVLDKSGEKGLIVCECLVKSAKRPKKGTRLFFHDHLEGEVTGGQNGCYTVAFSFDGDFMGLLHRLGCIPLPPYIRRTSGVPTPEDAKAYQTVYASSEGAVAAPTAGLHFTPELLTTLKERGITLVEITLHVGYGTFLPVRKTDIREHRMHPETYAVSKEAAEAIRAAKTRGSRIVAVGTTCVRTLEFASDETGRIESVSGRCDLFIYPGYRFKVIDGLITNFHLPRSTLLMLVSAFAGRERILNAYREAIRMGYRFYSFGDAMLIL
ncbi:MAG: tRNA preQ1(34) S-adenosylmethionine ribosyltransferase-isomerase QueA [Deltaproteobacteria bacterium]|nr:tRNA preQ1(34) S-adenosylmethionine ribosyltransferase-isomerase QueA [Deltaproteobacteria bacterium]